MVGTILSIIFLGYIGSIVYYGEHQYDPKVDQWKSFTHLSRAYKANSSNFFAITTNLDGVYTTLHVEKKWSIVHSCNVGTPCFRIKNKLKILGYYNVYSLYYKKTSISNIFFIKAEFLIPGKKYNEGHIATYTKYFFWTGDKLYKTRQPN